MITRWKSEGVREGQLPTPDLLEWITEKPHPDYTVQMAFAFHGGLGYRRVTFPDGSAIFSRLTYETVS